MSIGHGSRRGRRLEGVILALILALVSPAGPVLAADPPASYADAAGAPIKVLSAGTDTACIIRADDTLACWGLVQSPPPSGTFVDVSVGIVSTCAVGSDGRLTCWGAVGAAAPAGVFKAVSVESEYACAIAVDDSLVCWGSDDSTPDAGWPAPPAGTFKAVSVGWGDGACGIRKDDGTLACWGQQGTGEPDLPTGSFTAISRDCAIRDDGRLWCWGTGLPMSAEGSFSAISVGEMHSCAIDGNGNVHCWGEGESGELAAPDGTFRAVAVGEGYSCGITTDESLECWGHAFMTPAPAAFVDPLPRWRPTTRLKVGWSGTPLLAPLVSYDVRYLRSRWDTPQFGSTHRWLTATPAESGSFSASPGYTYCLQSRVRDSSGALSQWSWPWCTAIPLDDRALTRSTGWTALKDPVYYRSTALRTRSYGARLTLARIEGSAVAIVATTCPTCGTVKVYVGPRLLRTVRLVSATTVNRKLIRVFGSSQEEDWAAGRLTIRVVSSGRKVVIDGVAVFKQW